MLTHISHHRIYLTHKTTNNIYSGCREMALVPTEAMNGDRVLADDNIGIFVSETAIKCHSVNI